MQTGSHEAMWLHCLMDPGIAGGAFGGQHIFLSAVCLHGRRAAGTLGQIKRFKSCQLVSDPVVLISCYRYSVWSDT